jgi:hypothetical protein
MNTLQGTTSAPSALQWMEMNHLHISREADDYVGKSVSMWPSVAVVPFFALGGLSTNPAITYNAHIDPGYTNPIISLDHRAFNWPDEESGELKSFLSFMDVQIDSHPEWITPANTDQLDRLAKLLINVNV